ANAELAATIAFTSTAPRASAQTVFIVSPPSRPALDLGDAAARRQMDWLRIFSILDEFQCGSRLERFERTWLYVERALRSRSSEAAADAGIRQPVSAHDDMKRRRGRGNFGDQ